MKILRAITVETKVLSEKDHTVRYRASDQTLDCYGDIILARGWKFDRFERNAPFVDSHDYGSIEKLLGSVIGFRVAGTELENDVQWAADVPENKLAVLGWKMTVSGHLKAVSVGFFPEKFASKYSNAQEFQQHVTDLKLDPALAAKLSTVFVEQQQIELSACVIGANPNALAKAHTDGAISDGDLDAIGFTDDDMALLHESASLYERLTAPARALLDAQLRAIPFRKTTTQTATSAIGRAAAEAAQQHEREQFLREFNAVKSSIIS